MTYQKKTGTLSQGAHPGSYNGQDAYNDMLVTVPERERERVWVFTMQRSDAYEMGAKASTMAARQWKSPTDLIVMKKNMSHEG